MVLYRQVLAPQRGVTVVSRVGSSVLTHLPMPWRTIPLARCAKAVGTKARCGTLIPLGIVERELHPPGVPNAGERSACVRQRHLDVEPLSDGESQSRENAIAGREAHDRLRARQTEQVAAFATGGGRRRRRPPRERRWAAQEQQGDATNPGGKTDDPGRRSPARIIRCCASSVSGRGCPDRTRRRGR